jgi:hypothetical protein
MPSKKNNPQPQPQASPSPSMTDNNSGCIHPSKNPGLPSLTLTPTTSLTADSPQHGIQVYTGEDHNHGVRYSPAVSNCPLAFISLILKSLLALQNGNVSVSVSGPSWIIAMGIGYIKFLSKVRVSV